MVKVSVRVSIAEIASRSALVETLLQDGFDLPQGVSEGEFRADMSSTLLKILTADRNWWIPMSALFTDYAQARIVYRKWRDFVSSKVREEGLSGLRPISAETLGTDLISFKIKCSECGRLLKQEDFHGALIWEAWNELPDFLCNECKSKASEIVVRLSKRSYAPGEVVSVLGGFDKDRDISIEVVDNDGEIMSAATARTDPNGSFKQDVWGIPLDLEGVTRYSVAAKSDSKKTESSFYVSKIPFLTDEISPEGGAVRAIEAPLEIVYQPGSNYQFYRDLSAILSKARSELFVIDRYPSEELIDLYLSKVKETVPIRVLFMRAAGNFLLVASKFKADPRRNFEVRRSRSSHDRMIFVDESCFVIGQSIKDAAVKPTYLKQIQNSPAFLSIYEAIWNNAEIVA